MELALLALTVGGLIEALEQPSRVLGGPQQVRRFMKRVELIARDEDGIAASRGDLHGRSVLVHLLDEREEVFARLARGKRLLSDGDDGDERLEPAEVVGVVGVQDGPMDVSGRGDQQVHRSGPRLTS